MKEWLKTSWKIILYVLSGLLILSIALWISNSYPRQSVLTDYLKKQEVEISKKYDDQINQKNSEIDSLNFKINQIQQEYSTLKSQYSKLKKDYSNVQKPKDTTDTINRMRSLGFNPKLK